MVGKRTSPSTPSQPDGSEAEAANEPTFGEQLKASAAGEQAQPGVNDGTAPDEEPMVTYHGAFGKREITKEQWEQAGVVEMPTVAWERRTGFKVPVDAFTPRALQVLRQDADFRVPSV